MFKPALQLVSNKGANQLEAIFAKKKHMGLIRQSEPWLQNCGSPTVVGAGYNKNQLRLVVRLWLESKLWLSLLYSWLLIKANSLNSCIYHFSSRYHVH